MNEHKTMEWNVNGTVYNADNAVQVDDLGGNQHGYLFGDGMVIIDGEGEINDFEPVYYTMESVKSPYAFDKASVTKVHFTDNVKVIPNSLFYRCSDLKGDLVIPDSVVRIGNSAFGHSGINGTLTLSKNLKEIGDGAFVECCNLKGDLIIPDNVEKIGNGAFELCESFDGQLKLSKNLAELGHCAFNHCHKLKGDLVIPDNVKEIGFSTFEECSLFSSLTLSKNLKEIGYCAFKECRGLKGDLIIPDNVEKIGTHAFAGCYRFDGQLKLSQNLTEIGAYAFNYCEALKGDLVIPDNVKKIGIGAFTECKNLDGLLTLPKSLTEIGDGAFSRCSRLKGNITLYNNMSVGKNIFGECYCIKTTTKDKPAIRDFDNPDPRNSDKFIFAFNTQEEYNNYLKTIPEPEPLTNDDLLRILDITHADIHIRIPNEDNPHAMPVTALYASLLDCRSEAAINEAVKNMTDICQYVVDQTTGDKIPTKEDLSYEINIVTGKMIDDEMVDSDIMHHRKDIMTGKEIKSNKDKFIKNEYQKVDMIRDKNNMFFVTNFQCGYFDDIMSDFKDVNGEPIKSIEKYTKELAQKHMIKMLSVLYNGDQHILSDHPIRDNEYGFMMYKGHRVVLSEIGPVFAESNVRTLNDYNDLCKKLGREDRMLPKNYCKDNTFNYCPIDGRRNKNLFRAYDIFDSSTPERQDVLHHYFRPTDRWIQENKVNGMRKGTEWIDHAIKLTRTGLDQDKEKEIEKSKERPVEKLKQHRRERSDDMDR